MDKVAERLRLVDSLHLGRHVAPQVREMLRAEAAGNGGQYQYFTYAPGPGCLWQWNVNIAEALVRDRAPDGEFPVAKVKKMAEFSGARLHQEEIESERVDLSMPIICVGLRVEDAAGNPVYDGPFPIDGWHRLLRAMKEGVTHLPMHLLSDEENMLCRYKENETNYEDWVALHGVPEVIGEG